MNIKKIKVGKSKNKEIFIFFVLKYKILKTKKMIKETKKIDVNLAVK